MIGLPRHTAELFLVHTWRRRKKKVNPNTENSWNSQQRKHCGRFMWDREQGVYIYASDIQHGLAFQILWSSITWLIFWHFFPPTTWVSDVYRMARLCTSYPQLTQTGVRVVDAPRVCAAPSWWGASQWSQRGRREAWGCTSGRWLRTHKWYTHTPNQKNRNARKTHLQVPQNIYLIRQKEPLWLMWKSLFHKLDKLVHMCAQTTQKVVIKGGNKWMR